MSKASTMKCETQDCETSTIVCYSNSRNLLYSQIFVGEQRMLLTILNLSLCERFCQYHTIPAVMENRGGSQEDAY